MTLGRWSYYTTVDMTQQEDLSTFTLQASAATWPFFTIATILFGLRTVARLWYTEASFGWDDFVISLSWVCAPFAWYEMAQAY